MELNFSLVGFLRKVEKCLGGMGMKFASLGPTLTKKSLNAVAIANLSVIRFPSIFSVSGDKEEFFLERSVLIVRHVFLIQLRYIAVQLEKIVCVGVPCLFY